MSYHFFAVAIAESILGFESKDKSPPQKETKASLVDLPTLSAIRTAFNAHKGEARFLTLLSPT